MVKLRKELIDMAMDCIGLARAAVMMAEMLLFILRHELQGEGVHSIIHLNSTRMWHQTTNALVVVIRNIKIAAKMKWN